MFLAMVFGALALIGLMVGISATVVVTILGAMVGSQLESENRAIMAAAAQQMASEASNLDGDAVPEFTFIRTAAPGEPALPSGGAYLSALSAAPKTDVWGALMVVCAVDNGVRGTQPELLPLTAGTSNPTQLNAAPLFALIQAGQNGLVETDCTAALGGNALGDDAVRRVSVAEGMQLAGPLVASSPTTVEYGTEGIGSTFKVNGAIEAESLAVDGAASAGRLTLGQPLSIGDGGTSASTTAGAWLAILQGAPPDSLAWQVAGAVRFTGGSIDNTSIGGSTPASGNFSSLTVNGATVWTSANDGANSGLDADFVDGVQVQATGATTGQVLQFNGTRYAPTTLVAGGGGSVGLVEADTFQTVTARGASTNQVVSAAGYLYSSDPRLKIDMRPISGDEALSMVERLEGLRYIRISTAEQEIGFNAEATEKVVPELVRTGPDGLRSLAYGNLTAIMVQAMHEQQAQLRAASAQVVGLTAALIAVVASMAGAAAWRRWRHRVLLPALLVLPLLAAAFLLPGPAAAQGCPGGVPGSMRCIAAGATMDVTAYGTCRRITNTRTLAMLVPLGSAAEWTAAYSSSGAVATVSACYSYAWSGWSGWSACSASCGGGTQTQTRTCQRTETGVAGGTAVDASYCGGGSSTSSQSCNTQSCCTPNAHVTGYGGCSASCGGGSQTVYWEDGCGGSWTTSQSCNTQGCTPPPSINWNYDRWGGQCRHIAVSVSQGFGGSQSFSGSCSLSGQSGGWSTGGGFDITFCDDGSRRGCTQTFDVSACNGGGCTNSRIDIDWNY